MVQGEEQMLGCRREISSRLDHITEDSRDVEHPGISGNNLLAAVHGWIRRVRRNQLRGPLLALDTTNPQKSGLFESALFENNRLIPMVDLLARIVVKARRMIR
jgi:hypothetical protein